MTDEINSPLSQAIGRYHDARRRYVSLYKKATPVHEAELNKRDREMDRLQQELAEASEPLGIDWKADVQKVLGGG
jgi:hypothetical protein